MAAIVLILASAKKIEKVKKFLSAKYLRAALMSAVGHESNCLRLIKIRFRGEATIHFDN
jgi:hypothetical protein